MLLLSSADQPNNDGEHTNLPRPGMGEQDLPFLPLAEDTPNAALTNKADTTAETTQETMEVCMRSGCTIRPTQRYTDSMTQCEQGLVAWEFLMDQDDSELIRTSESQYEIQR